MYQGNNKKKIRLKRRSDQEKRKERSELNMYEKEKAPQSPRERLRD